MKCSIINVGTELLLGQINNTNSVFLSQELSTLGIDVMFHYTVGDNEERLETIMNMAFEQCDLVITTGGLGPTEDDITKVVACKVLNDKLAPHKQSLEALKTIEKKLKCKVTENTYKQAMMPSKALIFPNDYGTAPGFSLCQGKKTLVCLPGPPRELAFMWKNHVESYLANLNEETIFYVVLRLFGIGEAKLETLLIDLIDNQTDPTIATYAKDCQCSIRITSKRRTKEEAQNAVNNMANLIYQRVGKYIYSSKDQELAEVVGEKLIRNNIEFSCCESCTGGMFADTMAGIPGISKVFNRGLVTYMPKAKKDELGVTSFSLSKYTAESKEVAMEMVLGLKNKTKSKLCLSVTGFAGPSGGTPEKPPGTIYIGLYYDNFIMVRELRLNSTDRQWNRWYTVMYLLNLINKII